MMNMPAMPRWSKLLLIVIAALALLVALASVALNRAFPPERLAALIAAQVHEATGRDFAVGGKLAIRLLPNPAVVAQDVVLGNAAWGSRKDMLRVGSASFVIALWPLLRGRIDIDEIALRGVDLLLETDRSGVGNWVMQPAKPGAPAPPGQGSPMSVGEISRIALADVQVTWRGAAGGPARKAELKTLSLDADGAVSRLDASLVAEGPPWRIEGTIGRIFALGDTRSDWPFDLKIGSDGARIAAKGKVLQGPPPRAVDATLSASLSSAAAVLPWLDDAAALPLPIEIEASVKIDAKQITADPLKATVAAQVISGRVTVQNGSPWKTEARLASPSIDFARWLPKRPAAASAAAAGGKRIFGDTPIGVDAVSRLPPATLALQVQQLRFPGLAEVSALNVNVATQAGRLKVEPLSFTVAGGNVRGALGLVKPGGAVPRWTLDVDARDLSVDALMRAAGTTSYASGGRAALRGTLAMAGATPHAMAAGAGGDVLVTVADTTLGSGVSPLGTDVLPRLLQALSLKPKPTPSTRVECAVVRLPLKNGVAVIDRSIAMQTDQFNLSAKGEIRLDDETLELAFAPSPKSGTDLNPLNLASLVLLKGPILDPKLALDPKGTAAMALSLGAAGATGGLSLLADRLLRAPADPQPCRYAATGQAAPAAPAAAPAAKPAPAEKTVPDLLRRIFK